MPIDEFINFIFKKRRYRIRSTQLFFFL